jgi:NAD(P)-dependent dehydrogenase (short-subunit alcohol dehydrogenase family)
MEGSMSGRLAGKRAIVTGAGSGIGRAAAIKLAAEGAAVGILDIKLEAAEDVRTIIEQSGGRAITLCADVSDETQVAEAMETASLWFGGLDTIIANAGVMLFGRDAVVTELDLATWQATLAVNMTGMFLTCKYGVRALERAGGGAVVITASPTGTHGCARGFTAYSASKAGTFGLMRVLAADYAEKNIRVNAVLPGTTASPLVDAIMQDPAVRAEFMAKIPMGRPAESGEIGNVIAFLASDEASYVTGAAWYADGGLTSI